MKPKIKRTKQERGEIMREIRFRAWNKYSKTMYYTLDVGVEGNMDLLDFSGIGDSYELMQYTGLKDKNGKEIWEGDIVKYWLFPEATPTQWVIKIPNIYLSMQNTEVGQIEIIGNIYENPELLK